MFVFLGGGIGAAVREALMAAVAALPGGFPMPIFIANMTASFLIGILSALTHRSGVIGSRGKLLLTTGMMGGLSTFSSFVWGTDQMLANPGERPTAVVYLVVSMIGGLLLVEAGLRLGGRLSSRMQAADAG
jgi:fluoride exporter